LIYGNGGQYLPDYQITRMFGDYIIASKLMPDNKLKWGMLDKTGKEILPFIYDYEKLPYYKYTSGGYSFHIFKEGNKYGVINSKLDVIIPAKYLQLQFTSSSSLIVAFKDNKIGLYDTTGKIISPFIYAGIGEFSKGIASVSLNGKWGMMNLVCKLVIPAIYDEEFVFEGGMAVVKKNGKYGFINYKGRLVIPAIYDEASPFDYDNDWTEVTKNGKTFNINRLGVREEEGD
jgi:hypothetical protein